MAQRMMEQSAESLARLLSEKQGRTASLPSRRTHEAFDFDHRFLDVWQEVPFKPSNLWRCVRTCPMVRSGFWATAA